VASPLRERGYRGDNSIESLLYSLATGDRKTREELDLTAERIFTFHRALTIRGMGTRDMRAQHDTIPDWVFEGDASKAPFSAGTIRMDRDDMRTALDMFYAELGWDRRTGSPTVESYRRLGLEPVARELRRRDLTV